MLCLGERISADKRAKIENDLEKYKLQLSEMVSQIIPQWLREVVELKHRRLKQ
jgi:hypothetical protein